MLELPKREFTAAPAQRQRVPLWVGLYGPSGGGKTKSALRLADGIASIQGGPIYGIDTEAKRMLHYADKHKFQHIELKEPFGSLDYLAAIKFALKDNQTGKRPTVIIDSMSHEHEGPGGMIDLQDHIARRMATKNGQFDEKRYERIKMLAWAEPKAKRRALINGMLNLEANFILCFRAKESSVPMKKTITPEGGGRPYDKTEVVHQGFVPIGGDDFIYECTVAALLMPGARGVPTYHSELVGEKKMIKVPEQFAQLESFQGRALDEDIGAMLAKWAEGNAASGAPSAKPEPKSTGTSSGTGKSRAEQWVKWLEEEVKTCEKTAEVIQLQSEVDENLQRLKTSDEQLYRRADRAIQNRLASIDLATD
jgi:hypothetical protein